MAENDYYVDNVENINYSYFAKIGPKNRAISKQHRKHSRQTPWNRLCDVPF